MKNNNTFKEYVAPIVVLVAICLVITTALAATYGVAKPIIDDNAKKTADKTRTELLPAADKFTEFDGDLVVLEKDKVFVEDCFVADNKEGIVVTVKTKSFGGLLTEMVGIDKNGAITGVKVVDHADTPGLGTKAHDPKHLKQYKGKAELVDQDIKKDTSINAVTGATISSNGVHNGVFAALEQFKKVGGVK